MLIQSLPGFRDFFPEDFAFRRYIIETWRRVARAYGFREYDAPTLESAALYEKKNSGGEILEQLYQFTDRGERPVALRPEMTPSLARMIAARSTHYRKPIKWFSVGNFFRFERQQKGRLREFTQFNADLFGDSSPAADAEILALTIDLLRALGLGSDDFVLRLSDRRAWMTFLEMQSLPTTAAPEFLAIVDKMEREPEEVSAQKLAQLGVRIEDVRAFISSRGGASMEPLLLDLRARGMEEFVEVDLTIVRGLAYYTGVVFEVFDRAKEFRAVAGGGRYDHLIGMLSDGAVEMPAVGMGMGDVVLGKLIESRSHAVERYREHLANDPDCEFYVVVADEARRPEALHLITELRKTGRRVDFPLSPTKVGKQFSAAEVLGAKFAVVVGSEWPQIRVKTMQTREEIVQSFADFLQSLQTR